MDGRTSLNAGNTQLLTLLANPHLLTEMRAPTGLPYWDRYVGPTRGQFIVIGGEQGSGKSSYLLALLLSAARRQEPAALVSIEDVSIRLRARLLGVQARIDPIRLMRSELREGDMGRVRKAVLDHSAVDFAFYEGESRMDRVREILAYEAEIGTRYVGIDYLQALRDPGSQDRRNEVLNLAQEIAHFCRAHSMVALCVSQLVRPESRKVGVRPTRHWLKEASDIADAADKIVLVWREQDGSNTPTNVVLDKDKDGACPGQRWALQYDDEKHITEVMASDET